MRGFVLILMIALLPLRMWAAEGMAIRMAAHAPAAASMSMSMSMSMDHAVSMEEMPSDCPMGAVADNAQTDGSKSSGATCLTCQLCAAVDVSPEIKPLATLSPALPARLASTDFDSADPVREHKPPIS